MRIFNERQEQKLKIFHGFAQGLLSLSTCKRAKVGAIIFPLDFTQVYAIGYNGQPRGLANDLCKNKVGQCGCVHAEANAIVKLRSNHDDLILLSTTCPCIMCAGLIVNDGRIQRVIYCSSYRSKDGFSLLNEAGIMVYEYRSVINEF